MLIGSHTIIQSKNAEADKAFLRDVLGLQNIDSGGGWLIFALPPSEVAVHPSSKNGVHELYFICDDIEAFVAQMKKQRVPCSPIGEQRWGRLVQITLPSGSSLGVYQALHARPKATRAKATAAKSKSRAPAPRKPAASTKRKSMRSTKAPKRR
jgi:hypothetical protein